MRPIVASLTLLLLASPAAQAVDEPAATTCASVGGYGVNDRCPTWESVLDLGAANNRCFSDEIPQVAGASRTMIFVAGKSCRDDGVARDWPPFGVTVGAFDAATGARAWSASLPLSEPGYPNDDATGLAVSPAGDRVFVTSTHWTGSSTTADPHAVTAAFNATTGAQLWRSSYQGPSRYTRTGPLAVSSDGNRVFVTGYDIGETTPEAYGSQETLVLAYDAATGELVWSKRHRDAFAASRPDRLPNIGFDIATAGDRVFVATNEWAPCSFPSGACATMGTLALRDDREQGRAEVLWNKRVEAGKRVCPGSGMALGPDVVILTGHLATGAATNGASCASSTGSTISTTAFDASAGTARWTKTYAGECAGSGINRPAAIAAGPSGDVYVLGQSPAASPFCNTGYATLAYKAADGTLRWAQRDDGPGGYDPVGGQTSAKGIFRTPMAIAASPDGARVYVTGLERSHADNFWSGVTFVNHGARTISRNAQTGALVWSAVEAAVGVERASSGSVIYHPPVALAVSGDSARVAVLTTRQYVGHLATLNLRDYDLLGYAA